jgi:hypothetical protein
MNYTTKQIEDAAKKLHALPAKKRTKDPSSKQAVRMLQAEFAALLERGYSLEQAGQALHNAGIEISPLTVLESLGSASSSPEKRTSRTKSAERAPTKRSIAKRGVARRKSVPPGQPSTTLSLAAVEPPSRRVSPPPLPPLPPLLPALPRTQRVATSPPSLLNRVFQRGNLNLAKATFQVRPDTPDSEL